MPLRCIAGSMLCAKERVKASRRCRARLTGCSSERWRSGSRSFARMTAIAGSFAPSSLVTHRGRKEPSPISSAARADPAYLAGASGAVCFYQVSVRFSFAAEDGMPAIVIRSLHAVSKSSTSMSIPTARTTRNAASVPRLRPLPDEPAPGQRTAVPPPPQSEAKQPIVPLGGNSPAPRAHSVGLRERAGGGT